MLWAYAKAIPPAAESSELLEVVSDEVCPPCLCQLGIVNNIVSAIVLLYQAPHCVECC